MIRLIAFLESLDDFEAFLFMAAINLTPARFEREKKIAEFERQSRELAEAFLKAPDEAARKTLRANRAEIVTQLFDLREQNRQEEVKRMEADLKQLKDTLEQRQKNRAKIIERRIQKLTGEAGAMEWG